ncbi:tol-pal system protein YbgF [Alteromonas sp. KC3]|uniref:tol-pal system protein YbgF n=1 Tax=unclassified Alteromonas TaxID=2614992 RepID=UPI0019245764|nr:MULTISPECIES: tol-pal system protein YbgF [unclassified Alteromonas]BCO18411.1 tol-pal system protein YbgF [Alteromonas sp. KC3]BCO22372.1 tol-pal system protein YbgF [Alteromonas sp. KC14]
MIILANKTLKLGVTLSAALAVSTAFAQAPVVNANGGGELEQRIAVLERIVKSRTEMQHRLQTQLDNMQMEVDQLRGAVEVNTNELQKVLERQRELYLEIDKRVEALKQGGALQGNAMPSADVETPISSTPAVTTPQAPQAGEDEAYENAVNLILKSREYDKAIPAFQSFIQRFPNSSYAPNAHYWLGQLLFNQQNWSEASEQFNIVANRFSDSAKRPDALLKLGVIAERTGDASSARQLLQQVINEYPNSSAKRLAESRLNNL